MKIDRDVLLDLRELATLARRTPQKHLRYLVEREKAKLKQHEQEARAEIVRQTEASEALEGYAPLSKEGGYAYELQQQWIRGDIDIQENIDLLKKHYGIK